MTRKGTLEIPQVEKQHYKDHYDGAARWSSYWLQIEAALPFAHEPILEVGLGNGVVSNYLRSVFAADVTTVDIDPELTPDVVASITDLPFENGQFGCVIACEVIEHLPLDEAFDALCELRRVSSTAVISVPHSGAFAQLAVGLGFTRRWSKVLDLSSIRKRKLVGVPEEHFWELGLVDMPVSRLRDMIGESGWEISKEFRSKDNPYHYFFELR